MPIQQGKESNHGHLSRIWFWLITNTEKKSLDFFSLGKKKIGLPSVCNLKIRKKKLIISNDTVLVTDAWCARSYVKQIATAIWSFEGV